MKKNIWVFIIFVTFALTGCDQATVLIGQWTGKRQAVIDNSASVKAVPVDDVQLAKIILKPKRHKLTITRDPFEPLIKPKNFDATRNAVDQHQLNDELKGMQYVGLVKVGDSFSALIRTDSKKGVYKVNDQVGQLTITAIEEGSITFIQGSKTYKLKRGDL